MSNADCGLYDKVERWCKESVTENQPFLFDPELFRKMLEHKSEEFGFPYEVRMPVSDGWMKTLIDYR
jgi:hypothetical protein